MKIWRVTVIGIFSIFSLPTSTVQAGGLSEKLGNLFGAQGITIFVPPSTRFPHQAHFRSGSLEALGLLTSGLSSQAGDFPTISTVPGLVYEFNPQLEVFERVEGALGPIFVERPETLGQGRVEVGVSYTYVNFTELNGEDLDRLHFSLSHEPCCTQPGQPPPKFLNDTIDINFKEFKLRSHVVTLAGTYGVTNRLDVNVFVPVVYTSLRLRAKAHINNTDPQDFNGGPHFFSDPNTTPDPLDETKFAGGNHLGVGDVQLRAKFRFEDIAGIKVASGLALRLPTGSEDDFQGLGDFTLTPFLALAKNLDPLNLHAAGGIEVDPENTARSRARYAGGVAWQVIDRVALIGDLIGSSNLRAEKITVSVPAFDPKGTNGEPAIDPATGRPEFESATESVHSDIVDIAPGIKVNLAGSAVAFFSVLIPVNHSGLRSNFIPSGGLEMTF